MDGILYFTICYFGTLKVISPDYDIRFSNTMLKIAPYTHLSQQDCSLR
jgi:hypothetical protein